MWEKSRERLIRETSQSHQSQHLEAGQSQDRKHLAASRRTHFERSHRRNFAKEAPGGLLMFRRLHVVTFSQVRGATPRTGRPGPSAASWSRCGGRRRCCGGGWPPPRARWSARSRSSRTRPRRCAGRTGPSATSRARASTCGARSGTPRPAWGSCRAGWRTCPAASGPSASPTRTPGRTSARCRACGGPSPARTQAWRHCGRASQRKRRSTGH
mmetsp:Transcript_29847/g.84064  ORF Transcript_29847/g.84064 Transcript_29847/m.84064 type:complete len:213 (+) Transcript_29847:200-838(+)